MAVANSFLYGRIAQLLVYIMGVSTNRIIMPLLMLLAGVGLYERNIWTSEILFAPHPWYIKDNLIARLVHDAINIRALI